MLDIILEPGKFQGEATYVPTFYNKGLDGMADYDQFGIYGFTLTSEDIRNHNILAKPGDCLYLWESDDGFVYAEIKPSGECLDCEKPHENIGVCEDCANIYNNMWDHCLEDM